MGRTYLFSCEKCGYHARVSGNFVQGLDVAAQTIHCVECHELYDAVTAVRGPAGEPWIRPPFIEDVVNRLHSNDRADWEWRQFEQACPRFPEHEIHEWKHPGTCPRCGSFLEPSGMPFRVWD